MRLRRIVGAVNWRYALGEVALIVVGITVALAINAWYANLQDRKEEIEYLERLKLSLEADREYLSRLERAIQGIADRFRALEEHLRAKRPYKDDLDSVFSETREWRIAQLNTSVYESLRARGLDLISNPDLQMALIDVYERRNGLLLRQTEYDHELGLMQVGPYLYQHFALSTDKATPYDYQTLIDDPYYLNLVSVRRVGYEVYTLPIYRGAIDSIEDLIAAIDTELVAKR